MDWSSSVAAGGRGAGPNFSARVEAVGSSPVDIVLWVVGVVVVWGIWSIVWIYCNPPRV